MMPPADDAPALHEHGPDPGIWERVRFLRKRKSERHEPVHRMEFRRICFIVSHRPITMGAMRIVLAISLVCFFALILLAGIAVVFGDRLLSMLGMMAVGAPPPPEEAVRLPPDMARYFELKNRSCAALSRDFLLVTEDSASADVRGLSVPGEQLAMDMVLADYLFNETTKTYLSGERMKMVIIAPGGNRTTIWKDGRIYECAPKCVMRLLSPEEYAEYRAGLEGMRTSCAYFGNTEPPKGANLSRLLSITPKGTKEVGGRRCENFLISGNASYAQLLYPDSASADQRSLLWALGHFASPVQECLDENSGIVLSREVTLDLTGSYLFEFVPGGHMHVTQTTQLIDFYDQVPESFFALPS
jgi:hypothetical protein